MPPSPQKNVWSILNRFIKGVCKFNNGMENSITRGEFEQFLRQSYLTFSDRKYPGCSGGRDKVGIRWEWIN